MKIESKLIPCRADGTFSLELPKGSYVMEYKKKGKFMLVIYTIHECEEDEKEPWRS